MWHNGKENKGRPFKKGHRPTNSKPLGAERVTDFGYIQVKIAHTPSTWRLKHLVLWEAAHGPLPRTHTLYFLDGDSSNCTIENLYPYPKNGELKGADLARLLHPGQVSNFISVLENIRELNRETNRKAAFGAVCENNMRLIAKLDFVRAVCAEELGYVKH